MKYVCVIGGANVDICVSPFKKLKLFDSNPSTVESTLGGVGRNVAESLARLGEKVYFVTALGNDANAQLIVQNASECGIDLSLSVKTDGATSTYVYFNDEKGDMFVGASDMSVLEKLTVDDLQKNLPFFNKAAAVVADVNMPHWLDFLTKIKAPVFLDTVSANKTRWLADKNVKVFCLKPNVMEAEILSGVKISHDDDIYKAMKIIRRDRCDWVMVTNGANGVYYFDGNDIGHVKAAKADVVNTTGAGDSFLGAVVSGFVNGLKIAECAELGTFAASETLASKRAVSPQLNKDIYQKLRSRK